MGLGKIASVSRFVNENPNLKGGVLWLECGRRGSGFENMKGVIDFKIKGSKM